MKTFANIRSFPSPPINRGIRNKLLGHLAEMIECTKSKKQNIGMAILHKHLEWYRVTNSKTLELRFLHKKTILCSDPKVYKEVLGAKQDSFTNSVDFKKVFGFFFKTSMIVVDGEQWQRIRKVVQRAINKQSLDAVIPIMSDTISKLFSHQEVNKIETADLMNRITFDTFHRVMYGWDPKSVTFSKESSDLLESCNVIAEAIGKRGMLPVPFLWKLPTKENRKVNNACLNIKNFGTRFTEDQRKIIKSKITEPDSIYSLLEAMIIAADSGEDGGLTNDELIDQISTLFFGAYDTTSNTLLFLLNYLARYPLIQEKLRTHVKSKFPNGLLDFHKASLTDIESIDYLRYFTDEVQRLHAIAPLFSRDCIKDTEIAGFEIKKGTPVFIDSSAVALDSSFWKGQIDLNVFRPERWEEHTPSKLENILPFGFGARICPGRKIAMCEMKVFIANILLNYKISLRNPDENLELNMMIGLNLKHGNGNINFDKI